MKTIHVHVKESVWKTLRHAAKSSGISLSKLLEQSAMESKAVRSIANKPELTGNPKRIFVCLQENGPMLYSEIVDFLEPAIDPWGKSDWGKTAEGISQRTAERYRRSLVRNAILRLIGNGTLNRNEAEMVSLANR